jgi:hypothetical protein
MKLELYEMLKRGKWKGNQIIFYNVVMVPTLTCSEHTTFMGSELFRACSLYLFICLFVCFYFVNYAKE